MAFLLKMKKENILTKLNRCAQNTNVKVTGLKGPLPFPFTPTIGQFLNGVVVFSVLYMYQVLALCYI